ncbi:hopanoid-associated sugar epimerase [Sulfobacillus harzensis]|uniref:NAD-dependent epimerase/dehydratase family protein n=1 Tax=Sulfobacillus harzensis TaxID=2729629 RepID=A0A7Y0Q146_9FIRM|nr:hopanoid-associated sugar epimerase [Sulfobacillus harzensis]NMP21077.1 NAD-dependent epimerase/dehydratase family protein [Sulfobacillus harzensis]
MRVLVTGASGFIGWHVTRALLAQGMTVRALVRSQAAKRALGNLAVEVAYGDLATGMGLDDALNDVQGVFHVAARYSLERRHAREMYETNVGGTRRLIEAVGRHPRIERMVYTSSTAAVGLRDDGLPADETRLVDPNQVPDGYKRSKVLAEEVVREACRQGLDAVIVNPSTPVGTRDIKPTPTGQLIWEAARGRMPAYVDTGLNWVSVNDVAIGHILAWERGQTGERYILGHVNLTFRELLGRIETLAGVPAPRIRLPLGVAMAFAYVDELGWSKITGHAPRAPIAGVELARRPMFYTAGRAVQELGLPQTPIDEALREAIDWFRSFPKSQDERSDEHEHNGSCS